MAVLQTSDFSYRTSREATIAFTEGLRSAPMGLRAVFAEKTSDNLDERLVAMRGFNMFSARSTEIADPTELTGGPEGHSKLITLAEYLCQYRLSNRDFKKMPAADRGNLLTQQGLSAGYTIDYLATTLVANGFATTTTADSAYLFSDTHNVIGSGTDDNKATGGLAYSTFWAAHAMMLTTETSEGLKQAFIPRYLVVPPQLEQTAINITQSGVESAANQKNAMLTKGIQVIVCNQLTDADDWFLFAEPGWPGCPTIFYGERPTARYYGTDVNANLLHQYTMSFEVGLGVAGWRGCFGSAV